MLPRSAAMANFASTAAKFPAGRRRSYDFAVPRTRSRPGLARTRALPLVTERRAILWRSADHRWRELIESADVMSEGATRDEGGREVYYGTTSLVLTRAALAEARGPEELRWLAALAAADPHVRLRAVRIACLEAQLRAGGPLERCNAELEVRADARGIELSVEVEAPLRERRRSWRPLPAVTRRAAPRAR